MRTFYPLYPLLVGSYARLGVSLRDIKSCAYCSFKLFWVLFEYALKVPRRFEKHRMASREVCAAFSVPSFTAHRPPLFYFMCPFFYSQQIFLFFFWKEVLSFVWKQGKKLFKVCAFLYRGIRSVPSLSIPSKEEIPRRLRIKDTRCYFLFENKGRSSSKYARFFSFLLKDTSILS